MYAQLILRDGWIWVRPDDQGELEVCTKHMKLERWNDGLAFRNAPDGLEAALEGAMTRATAGLDWAGLEEYNQPDVGGQDVDPDGR